MRKTLSPLSGRELPAAEVVYVISYYLIIFISYCLNPVRIIEANDKVAKDGHVVRCHFVVNNFVADLLHASDGIVADDVVDDVNAVAPSWCGHVGVEGKSVLLQILGEHTASALHFVVCAIIVEIACNDKRLACFNPFLGSSLDDWTTSASCTSIETDMEAGEDIVFKLSH